MNEGLQNKIISIVVILVVAACAIVLFQSVQKPVSNLDGFASCLKDKGVIMYGAFWCPHCQAQKKEFGSAATLLPYTECSTPDGQSQNQICNDQKIEQYPTWQFPDGSRQTGEMTLIDLAQKSDCELPK